jgi:hypothetical protein
LRSPLRERGTSPRKAKPLQRSRYDDALKYAPNWKQLKDAREAAAKQKS